jgi:hypothetical protein
MYPGVEEHAIYQVANAAMRAHPYPHLYVEQVFPPEFYSALRLHWPTSSQLVSLDSTGRVTVGAYAERFIMPLNDVEIGKLPPASREFWTEFQAWFLGGAFLYSLLEKFDPFILARFGDGAREASFAPEVLIVRDHTNFKIGPHTDAPHRLLSLLFYCPDDESRKHMGTSIYKPVDPDFRCPGGPHHAREKFNKVRTMEYKPNTLFAFFKTDNSFHGVEPIQEADTLRDLILYDIRVISAPAPRAPARSSGLGVRMLGQILGFKR